jgi:tetratricopeptide (TPR) repeat protein
MHIHADNGSVAANTINRVEFYGWARERPCVAAVVAPITGDTTPDVSFVGRGNKLNELLQLLNPARGSARNARSASAAGAVVVLAVAGLAGVGKTALVRRAAQLAIGRGWYPAGGLFVDLHGYDPDPAAGVLPERLFASLLRGLGVPAEDVPADVDTQASLYQQTLAQLAARQQPMLLVADNASTVEQVAPLLPPNGGGHQVLVTSRHTLGELPSAAHLDLDVFDPSEAVQLIATAIAARHPADPRVSHDKEAADTLAGLCGYLPLALHIIAALLADDPGLPLANLAAELAEKTSRLDGLVYGSLGVRAAFDLSYQRLDATDARMFRLLSAPPGVDISTEAATALIGQSVEPARRMLVRLARAHLLDQHQPERWRMHDLLRIFARECATVPDAEDQPSQAVQRVLDYYCATLNTAWSHFDAEPGQTTSSQFADSVAAREWVETERFNLVAAVAGAGTAPESLHLAMALAPFLRCGRHLEDLVTTAELAVRAAQEVGNPILLAEALNGLGIALRETGRFEGAITAVRQALAINRELDDRRSEARVLCNIGMILVDMRQFDQAITAHRQALVICRRLGDRHDEAGFLDNLGVALRKARQFDEAISVHRQAVTCYEEFDDHHGQAAALTNLGIALRNARQFDEAIPVLQRVVAHFRELDELHSEAVALNSLGIALQETRRFDEAVVAHQEAVIRYKECDDRSGLATALNNLGVALVDTQRFDEAITAHQQATAHFRELDDYHGQAQALTNLGIALRKARQFDEAITAHQQATAHFRELDDHHGEAENLNSLGNTFSAIQRFEEAVTAHQQAAAQFRELNDHHREALALYSLGNALRETQHFAESIAAHQQAAAQFRELNDHHNGALAHFSLGYTLLMLRRFDEAQYTLKDAVIGFTSTGDCDQAQQTRKLLRRLRVVAFIRSLGIRI